MSGCGLVALRFGILFLASFCRLLTASRYTLCLRLREAAVAVMAGCLILSPMPLASHYDSPAPFAAETAWDTGHSTHDHGEHGHSHGEVDGDDRSDGHLHGHDPADHSHQVAHFSGSPGQWDWPAPQRWPRMLTGLPESVAAFGIDRPPKMALPA